jgi:hypothetical protein
MFELKASKDPRLMSNKEWKAELDRISRVSFARRQFAFEQAATQAEYDRIRRRSPGWEPTPLPAPDEPEDIEDLGSHV